MANNPFAQDNEGKKKEQNWFMKTAIKAAAFGGTAFGIYGLWKMSGPARKILEKAVDDRMKKVIAEEQYKSSDHFTEVADSFSRSRLEILDTMKKSFDIDPSTAWTMTEKDISTAQSLANRAKDLELAIVSRLEEDASFMRPDAKILSKRPGEQFDSDTWIALNKKKTAFIQRTVSLTGREAEQLARVRYLALQEYLETYSEIPSIQVADPLRLSEVAEMSDFFSGADYFQTDQIKDGYGKESIQRISTIHESYMQDRKYADIYYRKIKELHRRYVLKDHTYKRTKVGNLPRIEPGGGYRQALYGYVSGEVFDPQQFRFDPFHENLFDSTNPEVKMRKQLTSKGLSTFSGKLSNLQKSVYTGYIENINKILKQRQQEGVIQSYSIDLLDYGTANNPDKRLRISFVHHDSKKYNNEPFQVEIGIGIDGRLPGSTPGLSQATERFHLRGRALGYNCDAQQIINTTQLNLIEFAKALQGSLFKGGKDSFFEDPRKFVKQINRTIHNNIAENAAATGAVVDMLQAMTVDDPSLRDIISSQRSRHHSAIIHAENFVISARNAKRMAQAKRSGKKAIFINIDLETLDNTTASPGKALMSKYAQIWKAGIVVQDAQTNQILGSQEITNRTGYDFFKNWDNIEKGAGFNENLRGWLRKGVLPSDEVGNEDVRFLDLLEKERTTNPSGWSNAKTRQEFVQELGRKIRAIKKAYRAKYGDDTQVFIGTKNGLNFDLRAFQLDDPTMFKELYDDVIDVQALHKFRDLSLGESNALNIEAVVKAMLGRLNIPEEQFLDKKGELKTAHVLRLLKKKQRSAQGQNTALVDWTAQAFKKFHKHKMVLRAHASPRVDAIYGAALTNEIIGDYLAGNSDYLDAADYVQRLLDATTKGPASPESLLSIYKEMNSKTIKGFGVQSFSAASQGMVSKLIASFLDINDLNVFADPNNMAARRMAASPFNMTLAKRYLKKADPKMARQYLGRFLTNQNLEEMSNIIMDRTLRPEDVRDRFSNTVMGNFVYLLDHVGDPTIALTNEYMNMFERRMEMSVPTDVLQGDPLVNQQINRFLREVKKTAEGLARGQTPNPEQWRMAEKIVRAKEEWGVHLSEEILSASKFGGDQKFPSRALNGRIVSVQVDRDTETLGKVNPTRLIAKIEYTLSGYNAFKNSQLQLSGGHAVAHHDRTISEGMAVNILGKKDIHGFVGSEFLKKGHVGAAKKIMLGTLLKSLYDQSAATTDPKVKSTSKRLIKEIARELKADVDLAGNKFVLRRGESEISEAVRIMGDNEIRMKQIVKWYKNAGLVWNKDEIADLHKNGYDFGMHKNFMEEFKAAAKMDLKQLASKNDAYRDLTQEQFKVVSEDLQEMAGLFNIENPAQTAKIFMPIQTGAGWRVGLVGLSDSLGIYNTDLTDPKNRTTIFRQDYLLGLMGTFHGANKTTMEFLTRHTYASRFETYKSVLATHRAFHDAMFSERLMHEPMNIEQISHMIDIKQRIEAQSQKAKMAAGYDWGQFDTDSLINARRDRDLLLEKQEELEGPFAEKIKQEVRDINEALGKKKGATKILESLSRFNKIYRSQDITALSEAARNRNGILTFALPSIAGTSVNTIDLEQIFARSLGEITGRPDLRPHEVKNIQDKLIYTLKERTKNASKDSPIRFEDGKLHMGALIMDWDPYTSNMFTILPGGAGKASAATEMKMQVMNALHHWQKLVQASKGREEESKGLIDAARDEFNRKYVTYLLVGQPADTMSKFWQAGQFAPEGLYLMHKDVNVIHQNIVALENTKRGGFSKTDLHTVNMIKQARIDTVLISEKQFRNFRFVDDNGGLVSAARAIEEKLGQNLSTEYAKGRRVLPGGLFIRHPIPQAGYDGIRTGQFIVVPHALSRKIGMDENSFYAHNFYTAGQGGDFDGDHFFIHLKELGVHYSHNEMKEADDRTFQDLMRHSSGLMNKLKDSQIEYNPDGTLKKKVKVGAVNTIIGHGYGENGGETLVSTIDLNGNIKYKTVSTNMLDMTSVVNHSLGLIANLAKHSASMATEAQLLSASEAAANTLISKHLIPLTTNLLKTRVQEILNKGGIENPTRLMSFVGNIEHGAAGATQKVIDIAKHPEQAAKLSAVLNWLQNPGKETESAKEYWLDMRKEQVGTSFDKQLEEDTFNFYNNQLQEFEILRKNSPTFKIAERQTLDATMGRKDAQAYDLFNSWLEHKFADIPRPDSQKSVIEELNDAFTKRLGKQTDISPVFRKAGKWGAIGAAAFLGLSMFTPFGNSKSLNPIDMFVDLGEIDGNPTALDSELELPRNRSLAMVDASFSKEAFIRMNNRSRNNKKNQSNIINSMLMGSALIRSEGYYEFQSKPYKSYSNYTTRVPTVGTNELNRRSSL